MTRDERKQLKKNMGLRERLTVVNEMAFATLLIELGYRTGLWTKAEDDLMIKLIALAKEAAHLQLETIQDWKVDGRPESC